MELLDRARNTVLKPLLRNKVDAAVRHGHRDRALDRADDYGIDQDYVEEQARERFNELLGYTTQDPAAYARDMGFDREWARQEAIDWVDEYMEAASRGNMTRDRRIGSVMEQFDLQTDDVEHGDDIEFHVYLPDRTASEELADAILTYRDRGSVEKYSDLDGPRYAYAEPDQIRERIEEQAVEEHPDEFQAGLDEWYDGTASDDVYQRLDIGWAASDELDDLIDSFWEPGTSDVDLISVDIST
ncbi:MAG: hypothetical protein SV186_06860 [Candidatus Nanohaloarchaea archaeon]|nr:hypothetical protein [Candidatus Nanohaloarchaea archaeon]